MDIDPINLARLLNSEHLALAQNLCGIICNHLEALPELEPLSSKLRSLVDAETQRYKMLNTSEFTEQKLKADQLRNSAARQLLYSVRAFEYSDVPDEAEAMHTLNELLKNIPTIVDEPYVRETVDLFNLTARLAEEPFASAVAVLGVENLVQKVNDRNTAFSNLSAQQAVADAAKESSNMNVVRKQVDGELRRAFRIIKNRFDRETATDDVVTCVKQLNYTIREAQIAMNQRVARSKKGDNPPPESE